MPVLSYGHVPGSRGELLFSTHPAAPVFNPRDRTFSDAGTRGARTEGCRGAVPVTAVGLYRPLRRVTAQDAAATPPATVKTAGQAPTFLARGCEPAKAAT